MANAKISALTSATTPVAGTEVLPIVQSSTTKQVSIDNLTAGRAISATQLTLTTGNLIVANGKGIDFSATPGAGTSELLADYEEGTFTPTWNGGTVTVNSCFYTKVGRQVTIIMDVTFGVSVNATSSNLSLPFTPSGAWGCGSINYSSYGVGLTINLDVPANGINFRAAMNSGNLTCAQVSTQQFVFMVTYFS